MSIFLQEKEGIWDCPKSTNNDQTFSIDPDDFVVPSSIAMIEVVSKEKYISDADRYFSKAKDFCKKIILSSVYPSVRVGLEEFVEEFTEWSTRLKRSEVDRSLPLPKQKSMATSILNEKRRALADYFKTLITYGVSYAIGNNTWKNHFEEVLDLTIAPVEVEAALKISNHSKIENIMLNHWKGCERYFLFDECQRN